MRSGHDYLKEQLVFVDRREKERDFTIANKPDERVGDVELRIRDDNGAVWLVEDWEDPAGRVLASLELASRDLLGRLMQPGHPV